MFWPAEFAAPKPEPVHVLVPDVPDGTDHVVAMPAAMMPP
jgi:hypothetical protein